MGYVCCSLWCESFVFRNDFWRNLQEQVAFDLQNFLSWSNIICCPWVLPCTFCTASSFKKCAHSWQNWSKSRVRKDLKKSSCPNLCSKKDYEIRSDCSGPCPIRFFTVSNPSGQPVSGLEIAWIVNFGIRHSPRSSLTIGLPCSGTHFGWAPARLDWSSHYQYLELVVLKSFGSRDWLLSNYCSWALLVHIQFQNIYFGNNLEITSFSPSAHWCKIFIGIIEKLMDQTSHLKKLPTVLSIWNN